MNATKTLQYLERQRKALQVLIDELDEVQVTFNAQFDEFKAEHDTTLDALTEQIASASNTVAPDLRAAIQGRLSVERDAIAHRREKVREEYLPARRQTADELLAQGQLELAEYRRLNPELDEREEKLKKGKAHFEAQLRELNEEIKTKSKGFGLVRNFKAITKTDRERQRIIGRLESINDSLYHLRSRWERDSAKAKSLQSAYQRQWQLESIAVARLQSELDQLDDEVTSERLAERRAIRHVLDDLKEPADSPNAEVKAKLQWMADLNVQTDDYHTGLAAVGGFIGLLRGIQNGLDAVHKSIDGLAREEKMHSAYLKALDFHLPDRVEAFHHQWAPLAKRFANEETIGAHPSEFAANVQPLLEGPLAQAEIEAMFNSLGAMIAKATARWT
jgi:chromosome segregation ATPase